MNSSMLVCRSHKLRVCIYIFVCCAISSITAPVVCSGLRSMTVAAYGGAS